MNRKLIFDSNCVLKSIFSREENIYILKDFIESILNIKICKIHQRKDLNYEEIFERYFGIANVTIVTDTNKELNIGIQIVDGLYIQNKMFLHYAQLYSNIIKTITINILDCEYFKTKEYHKIIKVKDFDIEFSPRKEIGEIHVLELPKFKNIEIDNKEKAWISYLKQSNLSEEIKKKYESIEKLDSSLNQYWKEERL